MSTDKTESAITLHGKIVETGLLIGLWVSAFIMFITLGIGLYKIIHGLVVEFMPLETKKVLINELLEGLELIFVSPLAYLLVLSLLKYNSAVKPRLNPDLKTKSKYIGNAKLEITTVKSLSVSLFISIIILHTMEDIFTGKLTLTLITIIGFLLAILICWYYLLDRLSDELEKKIIEL
ncbi:hypothetical protein A3860_36510 [Niastella vici]|uniref:DUF2975 domain-containing protein n=1 Tax=Niastella vici TaxID=1703345 RepID=A0A1V9FMU7_9BACT|nr:hypothetical protein [Niastella vici]OQP59675.1 hypothetical protein A3860_36510 [Niastella vici]